MHLKRLDLVGFKSFAARTAFLFEPGITVLCGPNGSGKSNVADAVRWALGEQSARAIRGRKGEDVIFVGSQGRQPLGLAEVSLTLDNAEGRLPLDFAEVKIARRLYRSGEAEYLANGAKVRLKDIHQWLLHAALDPDGYVVVGQGSVDELILQRAEERRVVIDNAADIRRHQTRLTETRSRLAQTEENLLRCRAVIAELEPHVARLRAQAERAERYQAVRAELSTLAAGWFRHALAGARAELLQAKAQADAARTDADRREAAVTALEEQVRAAELRAATTEAEIGRHEPALTAAQAEVARIGRELARAEERLSVVGQVDARADVERAERQERLAVLQREIGGLEERLAADRVALADVERAISREAQADAERQATLRAAEANVAQLRRQVASAETEARASSAAVDDGRARVERAERRRVRAGEDLERLEGELAGARAWAEVLAAEARRRADELAGLRADREARGAAREEARRTLDALRAEQYRLAGERQRLEIARSALADVAAAQKGGGAGALLGAGLPGALGLLAGELDVPAGLQAAVNAALGESAQAILVERDAQAADGIRLARERNAGRVGLVAADVDGLPDATIERFKRAARASLDGVPVRGFADELIRADPALDAVRARFLGLVLVVDDVEAARTAADRLACDSSAHLPWQVVTTAGVVIRWTGEWRVGTDRAGERLVARRRELAELDGQLAQFDAQITGLDAQLAEADRTSRVLADEDATIRARLQAGETADRQAALAAQAAGQALARLEREALDLRAAAPAAEADAARAARQVEEAGRRLAAAERRRVEAGHELAAAEARVVELRQSWDAERAARADRQADVAGRRVALQGGESLLQRLRGDLAATARAIEEAERRERAEVEQRGALAVRVEELTAALKEAEAALAPLQAALDAARAARRDALTERAEHARRADELRSAARSQRTVLEAAIQAETRATDRLERTRREALEFVEDVDAGEDVTQQLRLALDGDEAATSEDMPPEPPIDPEATRRRMNALRRELRAIGSVGAATLDEFRELRDRHAFLVEQVADLETTGGELRGVMDELVGLMRGAFDDAFARVNAAFGDYFARLFAGGHAELVLSKPDEVLESGVDIVARPPGKRLQPLVSLSGGERALTMVALIFALLKTNPAPFCVLDEVDAALDESNVRRFTQMLGELSETTQFIVVSHNRATMEAAQALYGISMDTQGVSTVVSLKLPQEVEAVVS